MNHRISLVANVDFINSNLMIIKSADFVHFMVIL